MDKAQTVRPSVVVMGVSGAGKSTLGAALAAALGVPFRDGDDYHPPENRATQAAGRPLTDAMRAGWLDRLAGLLADEGAPVVLACSALRRAYRDRLRAAGAPLVFLHLAGDEALIRTRIEARRGHFMPPSLLPAQFATLEPPGPDEPDVVPIDAGPATPEQVAAAVAALKARGAG